MFNQNTGRAVDLIFNKNEVSKYIPTADARILSQLGYLMLNKEIPKESIEENMGSDVIEALLDEIEFASYDRLKEIHTALKTQGLIK